MSKGNEPAFPVNEWSQDIATGENTKHTGFPGLTKREYACIRLKVPRTGDPELDAIIREANRRDAAALAMQGQLTNPAFAGYMKDHPNGTPHHRGTFVELQACFHATHLADALLAELEKTK